MNRPRPLEAVLAALASLSVALPLTTLFISADWFGPALVLVVVVVLVGVGMRSLVESAWGVGATQVVVGTVVAGQLYGQGHLWFGLPGPDTFHAFGILIGQAARTIQTSTAPAPTTRGIVFLLGLLLAVTALAVDLLAVTLRSPSLAGLPLLAAYLASATNSGDGLAAPYFVLPAALWMTMVGRQGVASMRRWSTAVTRSSEPTAANVVGDSSIGFAGLARVLGVGTILAAVVLTPLIPRLPTTFIAEGLGRSDNSRGVGGGGLRLSSTIDIGKDLGSRSGTPIITYTSTAPTDVPLRVDVLSTYSGGEWRGNGDAGGPSTGFGLGPQAGVPVVQAQLTVTSNRVSAPQIALPELTTSLDAGHTAWTSTSAGVIRVAARPDRYTAGFEMLQPQDSDFQGTVSGSLFDGSLATTLEPDQASLPMVATILRQIVPEAASPLEAARDIQAYLRSPAFTYSLQLDPAPAGEDPLSAFLTSKKGYCVQFATAMVMMARVEGIPARMAIGFLPGAERNGVHTVVASDAHAWPELFFPRLGWVRFEPTPGTRTGVAPGYTTAPVFTRPSPSVPSQAPSASASPTPVSPQKDLAIPNVTSATGAGGPVGWLRSHGGVLGALLVLVLLVVVLPVSASLRRRRARARAADDAARVEVEWAALVGRLEDVGVRPPEGTTPRQAGAYVVHAAHLGKEPEEALGRVVATLERGRYAVPDDPLPDVRTDARTVWRAVAESRAWSLRARAALAPTDGMRVWTTLAGTAGRVGDRVAERAAETLSRVSATGRRPDETPERASMSSRRGRAGRDAPDGASDPWADPSAPTRGEPASRTRRSRRAK